MNNHLCIHSLRSFISDLTIVEPTKKFTEQVDFEDFRNNSFTLIGVTMLLRLVLLIITPILMHYLKQKITKMITPNAYA